ncbi:MAG: acyl-CoA synthetase [Elusimicrobia bacterium CG_4_10_14_0_8_um_filter_37_32]|nr:MAG: acyl-CoA synthetase [Elusimicrobia bacterium CG_4_10_14_0_8_um_filter_37_32]
MNTNIESVFSPKSIAVIGASRKEGSVGRVVFSNILLGGFTGLLFPVNPKSESIMGVKCYPNINAIPDPIDLAVLIVPNEVTPSVIKECGQKGVKSAIIISAGFKEIGGRGIELEKETVDICKKYKISLVGPNCLGIINTDSLVSMNASFGKDMPIPGNIAFISQSGALCTAVLDYTKGKNIGFSKFISMGNKAYLNEIDFLSYLGKDPQTKVILMYVEDISDTKEFMKVAREITSNKNIFKPIITIKSGRTKEGAKAASSHTGALAGSDELYSALFVQSGVLRVETVEELFENAIAFANSPIPKGNKIAIVTNAGGPGIMATDASIRYGLELAKLEENTITELKKYLPKTANFNNPIDIIGDALHDRYESALKSVLKDKNVDGVIVILTPQAMTDIENIANTIVEVAKKNKKPVLTGFMGVVDVSKGIAILERNHIPHYRFPEKSARVLRDMYRYGKWVEKTDLKSVNYDVDRVKTRKVIDRIKKEGRNYLPEIEALEILNAYGFPTLESKLAKNADECVQTANEIGYPVAMKIVSPDIIHKFDVKGVILKLKTDAQVKQSYKSMMNNIKKLMPRANLWGVNIQQMAGGDGEETIIGAKRDEIFGPVIMFGLGGIFVEAIRDVTFGFAPISPCFALNMVQRVKTYRILEGVRGKPPADIKSITECLQRLSQLILDFEEISEIDMNPLIVYQKGCKVADVRIILK